MILLNIKIPPFSSNVKSNTDFYIIKQKKGGKSAMVLDYSTFCTDFAISISASLLTEDVI